MPQTSVLDAPQIAYPGQLADSGPSDKASRFAEGAGILAGQPLLRGTDPAKQVVAITNGATLSAVTFGGWAVLDNVARYAEDGEIEDLRSLSVLKSGRMFVKVTAAVVAGNPVYVGTATAQLGNIDDATGTGLTIVPGARFETSAAADGYAVVQQDHI